MDHTPTKTAAYPNENMCTGARTTVHRLPAKASVPTLTLSWEVGWVPVLPISLLGPKHKVAGLTGDPRRGSVTQEPPSPVQVGRR